MSSEDIFQTVRDLVADRFEMEPERVTMETSFEEDLNADSVDLVELIMDIEGEFGLEEEDDEDALTSLKTVGDCVEYLLNHVG